MRAEKSQCPNCSVFSGSLLDLGQAKEEDFRLPLALFVILDVFRGDCMSDN